MPSFPRRIPYPGSIRINVEGAFIVDDDDDGGSLSRVHGPADINGSGSTARSTHNRDIVLPYHTAEVSHIAVDIGGSLAKLVYFSRAEGDSVGGRLNFTMFETENIEDLIAFMAQLISIKRLSISNGKPDDHDDDDDDDDDNDLSHKKKIYIMATGGGAYKFYDRMRKELDVEIWQEDEMKCLIVGLDFFITEIPNEVFMYSEQNPMSFVEARSHIYPYLLVNIGSGVSMIMVSGPQRFKRIGGSSLGGGTLWGLLSLLTGAKSFDEMLEMASRGDNANVDMLVGDIYGSDYGRIGLKSTTIASSFGKVFKKRLQSSDGIEISNDAGNSIEISDQFKLSLHDNDDDNKNKNKNKNNNDHKNIDNNNNDNDNDDDYDNDDDDDDDDDDKDRNTNHDNVDRPARFKAEDISRSLLYAISNNIGQIAYLQAQRYDLQHIYFGGSFIRGHPQTMNTLSYAIKFWSNGDKQAYFLRHEGYLGAVGAFLKRQPSGWGRRNSMEDTKRVVLTKES
ncbi:type II pantothenate kinase [Lipomyces japonicus]|uniref:type II pantothenate kinase n=1 Tax=Lipomyces japonicus TaxID=56871 RepID=UPI0034CFADE1